SRQIVLIGLFWAKYARRIFAIVSTTSIPDLAPVSPTEATVDPPPRGPDWMPITPKTGSLFHADLQLSSGARADRGQSPSKPITGTATKISPYLDRPLVPLAVALLRILLKRSKSSCPHTAGRKATLALTSQVDPRSAHAEGVIADPFVT